MEPTETRLNPQMIVLARESRGLSQKDLADKLLISAGKLCRAEQDEQPLSEESADKLSEILHYPKSFFFQQGEGYVTSSLNFRKRVNVSQQLLIPLEARINVYRLNIETLFSKIKLPEPNFPVSINQKEENIEETAKKLRKFWKLPSGAIHSLTEVLEFNKIIIVSLDFGTERVDSRAMLTQDMRPVIVLNKRMLGDRQRFSMAYELGHLIMPPLESDKDHAAKAFAGEFLMPAKDISKDFEGDITLVKLGELKKKWKVSMQALLYRASDLGFITDNQKRYLISQFNALNIRRREPKELDVPIEKPILLRDLITKYRIAQKLSIKELAKLFHLEQEEFLSMYAE